MTDSIRTLEIPIPEDAMELLGFSEDGIFQVDISEGRLVLTQKKRGVCVFNDDDEDKPDCEDCRYSCPHCGACNAPQFYKFFGDLIEEQEAENDD